MTRRNLFINAFSTVAAAALSVLGIKARPETWTDPVTGTEALKPGAYQHGCLQADPLPKEANDIYVTGIDHRRKMAVTHDYRLVGLERCHTEKESWEQWRDMETGELVCFGGVLEVDSARGFDEPGPSFWGVKALADGRIEAYRIREL